MTKRKPTILAQQINDDRAVLMLKIDAAIADFQGHFSSYPLLPGVTQIDWAVYFGTTLLNTKKEFGGMEVIKFQEPIVPDDFVVLTLNWQADNGVLLFRYHSMKEDQQEKVIHSSGKIRLNNPTPYTFDL